MDIQKDFMLENEWKIGTFNCICPETSHVLRFFYHKKRTTELYVNLILKDHLNFLQRLYVGLLTIFNIKGNKLLDELLNVDTTTHNYAEYDAIWSLETVNEVILFLKNYRHHLLKCKEEENKNK